MMDYEYIDMSAWCNAGIECLPGENPLLGEQSMRGLPFIVGSRDGDASEDRYISLAEGESAVAVPIGKVAHKRHIRAQTAGDGTTRQRAVRRASC